MMMRLALTLCLLAWACDDQAAEDPVEATTLDQLDEAGRFALCESMAPTLERIFTPNHMCELQGLVATMSAEDCERHAAQCRAAAEAAMPEGPVNCNAFAQAPFRCSASVEAYRQCHLEWAQRVGELVGDLRCNAPVEMISEADGLALVQQLQLPTSGACAQYSRDCLSSAR
jgi:hypothetical protein